MVLQPIEILSGILSLIFVLISTYIGLRIASRYTKHKQITLILVGISWIGISSLWIAPSISILLALSTGEGLTPFMYFFIANAFIPFYLFIWMMAITEFLYKDKQKMILLISALVGTVIEIIFLYFLFTEIEVIGELTGPVDTDWGLFMTVYYLLVIVIMVITGTLFGRESLKSDNPETKLKGKFILAAFYIWLAGCLFDTISAISIIILIMARITLIVSSFLFYLGFILPDSVKKRFLKNN